MSVTSPTLIPFPPEVPFDEEPQAASTTISGTISGTISRSFRTALILLRDDALQIVELDEDLPWLRALVPGDDLTALEHVDQAAGSRVANAQAPLQQRGGRGLRLHDDLD